MALRNNLIPRPAAAPPSANPTCPIEPLLLTPDEAAVALRISTKTLWTLTQAGEIPAIKVGPAKKLVRYDPEDLRRWIEQQKAVAS